MDVQPVGQDRHAWNASIRDVVNLPLGHDALGIEGKDVLSTGVNRMLVFNRVGVGQTRSTINPFAPI